MFLVFQIDPLFTSLKRRKSDRTSGAQAPEKEEKGIRVLEKQKPTLRKSGTGTALGAEVQLGQPMEEPAHSLPGYKEQTDMPGNRDAMHNLCEQNRKRGRQNPA